MKKLLSRIFSDRETATMAPFKYGDFYDVPRIIIFKYRNHLFLLRSDFNDDKDDHEENYSIQILPSWVEQRIDAEKSWQAVWEATDAELVGEVPVKDVVFDGTKRHFLDASFLDRYLK